MTHHWAAFVIKVFMRKIFSCYEIFYIKLITCDAANISKCNEHVQSGTETLLQIFK